MHAVTDVHCWYYIHITTCVLGSECNFCVYSYLAAFDVVTGLLFLAVLFARLCLCFLLQDGLYFKNYMNIIGLYIVYRAHYSKLRFNV
jgi:hypothetical protein